MQARQLRTKRLPLSMENYFLTHRWRPDDKCFAFYTEMELRTLHHTFGHPSIKALEMLLGPTNDSLFDGRTTQSLENIREDCRMGTEFGSTPRRFKLAVGLEELRFTQRVEVDIVFSNNRLVIHMVDGATHFCAASFLCNQLATDT